MNGLLLLLAVAALLLVALLVALLDRGARRPPRRTAAWAIARGFPCDPGDLGLEASSWTLERPGAALPVWEIAGLAPEGPVVVVVHGWGQSRVAMLERVPFWRERASRVVLIDLRGHGEAQGGPSRLGAGEERDLAALLDRLGAQSILLEGFSIGGAIAVRAAAGDSRVVAAVVHGVVADFHRAVRGRLAARGHPTRPITDLALAWWRLIGLRFAAPAESAARLRAPLLVVHGADDPIAPPEEGRRLAAAAPRGRFLLVPAAGHGDAHRRDPGAVAAAIDALLAEA